MSPKINFSSAFFKGEIFPGEKNQQTSADNADNEISVQKWMNEAENGETECKH